MAEERKPSIDCQIVAAEAERLQQRAGRIQGAEEIARRLRELIEAARKPRMVEEEQAKGKDLANELNALEGELRAREDRAKRERKQDAALIDAVGKAANDLTEDLSR